MAGQDRFRDEADFIQSQTMNVRPLEAQIFLLLVAIMLMGLGEARAATDERSFCPAGARIEDPYLSDAMRAAFGQKSIKSGDDCIQAYKLLRYADADVLLTSKGDGGDATCHGCGAVLSATVLARMPTGFKAIARFEAFGTYGTSGAPTRVDAVELNGDDALAIEEGGVFQGFSSQSLSLVEFRNGRLIALSPALPVEAANFGGIGASNARVAGAWHLNRKTPTTLTIDYLVTNGDMPPRHAKASWTIIGDKLVLSDGAVPTEYGRASGRE